MIGRVHLLHQLSRSLNSTLPKQFRDFISGPSQLFEQQGDGQGRPNLVGLEKKRISNRASKLGIGGIKSRRLCDRLGQRAHQSFLKRDTPSAKGFDSRVARDTRN
eukprot:2941048-Pleurochrysis_carterae.AAC.1